VTAEIEKEIESYDIIKKQFVETENETGMQLSLNDR
jgi:hypothetical protein